MRSKRVLVTGSSRGIGRAIAQRLAQTGWSVALHYTNGEKEAKQTEKLLGTACTGIYKADLAQPAKATELFSAALADGPIHAIVNNAGVYMPLDFLHSGDAAFKANLHKTFAVNFESPLMLIRAAAKHFEQNGGGKVLNVATLRWRGKVWKSDMSKSKNPFPWGAWRHQPTVRLRQHFFFRRMRPISVA